MISGTGELSQVGPGTTILTGDNTYTGGTTITAGTLQLGNGGTTGSIIGNITNNGTLAIDRAGVVTLPGTIFGPGRLNLIGSGTTILTGENVFVGGTTISAGTLQLGNGGNTGSIVGNVTDNGTLAFDRTDVVTFPGVISGTGALSQIGTGTTVLTADETYTGGTTISAGTLQLGNGGSTGGIVGNVTDNGTLAFDRGDMVTFPGVISGTGGAQPDRPRNHNPDRRTTPIPAAPLSRPAPCNLATAALPAVSSATSPTTPCWSSIAAIWLRFPA